MTMLLRTVGWLALLLWLPLAQPQAQNKVPSDRALETLVKGSLLTLNDANVTGIYTVLHAKLSKPFRDQFSAERLAQVFRSFRDKQIDYDAIAALPPTYSVPPRIDDDGKLIVRGFFPTEPLHLKFELDFIPSDGEWKLIRVNVKTDD